MVYLDNAATGFPKSDAVFNAMKKAFYTCGNPGRSGHEQAQNADEVLYSCRVALAKRFNGTPENVILTSGATMALNLACKGLYRENGEVLISDLEHNAVLRPLYALRKDGKITLKQFRVCFDNDEMTLENFKQACKRVHTVVCTHASNVCGIRLPVERFRKVAGENAVLIVDASQTAGHIPIDIRAMGVDVLCIPGHKGLCGPMGTGALIVNPDRVQVFRTLVEGGSGIESLSKEMPAMLPERLEPGTPNVCGFAGLAAAAKEPFFPQREQELFSYLKSELASVPGIVLHGVVKNASYVPVLLFNKKGTDCETVAATLAKRGIAVRAGLHCAPAAHRALGTLESGGVRVSLGRYSTKKDVDALIDALKKEDASCNRTAQD